jgi:hypothetical protein
VPEGWPEPMNSERLETFLARLLVEAELRSDFLREPHRTAGQHGLDAAEQEALAAIDRRGLLFAARSVAAKRSARTAGRRRFLWCRGG